MLTTNVLQRTYMVCNPAKKQCGSGTAFGIDVNNTEYFITATSVVKNSASDGNGPKQLDGSEVSNGMSIWYKGSWHKLHCELLISDSGQISSEFAVFSLKGKVSPDHLLEPNKYELILGQEVYFAGFPFGQKMENPNNFTNGSGLYFPLAYVKRGIYSGLSEDCEVIYIDGFEPGGFQGGPVAVQDPLSSKGEFQLVGVITGNSSDSNGSSYGGFISCTPIKKVMEYIETCMHSRNQQFFDKVAKDAEARLRAV